MDITDEPGLFYYFLGREPSSRWYAPNGIVDTAELQRNLLAELRRAPPKLIIFDDTDTKMYGLPNMDGVPEAVRLYLISRWILAALPPVAGEPRPHDLRLARHAARLEPPSAPQSATGDGRGAVPGPGMQLGLRPDLPRRAGGAPLRRPGGRRAQSRWCANRRSRSPAGRATCGPGSRLER